MCVSPPCRALAIRRATKCWSRGPNRACGRSEHVSSGSPLADESARTNLEKQSTPCTVYQINPPTSNIEASRRVRRRVRTIQRSVRCNHKALGVSLAGRVRIEVIPRVWHRFVAILNVGAVNHHRGSASVDQSSHRARPHARRENILGAADIDWSRKIR